MKKRSHLASPHPTHSGSLSLLIAGNDELGLELAARLFPMRTGVPASFICCMRNEQAADLNAVT